MKTILKTELTKATLPWIESGFVKHGSEKMKNECLSFILKVAAFWEKTEDSQAQKAIMTTLSNYTGLFLRRVHNFYISIEDDNTILNQNGMSGMIDTEKRSADNGFQNETLETGQNETETKDNLNDILEIDGNAVPLDVLLKIFDKDVVCSASLDPSKDTFFGLIPGSGHLIYAFADYISSLTHVLSAAPFANKGACDIEESVINWVKMIVGYPDTSNGVTVSGSSMGDVVAFSAARDHLLPSSDLYKRAVVYVADHSHLSNIRALRVVGLGGCVYRCVPSVKHRIVAHGLDEMITNDIRQGLLPFIVIASMGGTSMGALDPLTEIQEIARNHNVWFHVDGSYGGFFLLDNTVKTRCQGINMADSITLDFHKGLSAPHGTAVVLIRQGHILSSAMSRGTAPYIQAPEPGGGYSPLDLSFEYTRPFRAFPIWVMLKTVGTEAVKSQLTEKIKLTKYVYDIVSQMENVSVYMEPDLSIIAFRCSKGNEMTRKWLELINKEGTICTTPTVAESYVYIRFCILSFRTHMRAVETALGVIQQTLDLILTHETFCNM